MTNIKKTADISIRLQKRVSLPKPQELIEMSHEARRAKKRIELPWQPEGRPEPALITVRFDEATSKSTWSIYPSNKSEAEVAWTEIDPDPTKIILALRDWYGQARDTEGWYKGANTGNNIFAEPSQGAGPGSSGQHSGQHPQQPHGQPPAGYPTQQPYPQEPGGVPVWVNTTQQPAFQYPYAPNAAPPAPPHWTQGAGSPTSDQPLPPELWALHTPKPTGSSISPMLGDLLVAAGVIPTRTLQAALTLQNTGRMERRKIGEILVSSGALPTKVLDAAIKLQDMARTGTITSHRVTELLRQVYSSGSSITDLLQSLPPMQMAANSQTIQPRGDRLLEEEGLVSEEDREKLKQVMALLKDFSSAEKAQDVLELLRKAAIVNEETIAAESKATKDNPIDTVKALVVKEYVDPTTFEAALSCQKLIKMERLKVEQAIIALGYCSRMRTTLRDAICDLNWLIPMDGI